MKVEFHVGDRVILNSNYYISPKEFGAEQYDMVYRVDGLIPGKTGVVIKESDRGYENWIRVAWDEYNPVFHSMGGACDDGHGWCVYDYMLDYVIDDIEDIGADVEDIECLLYI